MLGSHVFTVTGTDVAGNSATASHGYVVFEGIYGPITKQAVFKAGRTIPIILELGSHALEVQVLSDGVPVGASRSTVRPMRPPAPTWPPTSRPT